MRRRRNESASGALEPFPSSIIFWKTGISFSGSRIQTEINSSSREMANGMRQPAAANAVSPICSRVAKTTARLMNSPKVAVVWIQLV